MVLTREYLKEREKKKQIKIKLKVKLAKFKKKRTKYITPSTHNHPIA